MNKLPQDVLLVIFRLVAPTDLLRLACVCKRFNVVASHDLLWKALFSSLDRHFIAAKWTARAGGAEGGTTWKERARNNVLVMPAQSVNVKCVVVGDAQCGKSCLIAYVWREGMCCAFTDCFVLTYNRAPLRELPKEYIATVLTTKCWL